MAPHPLAGRPVPAELVIDTSALEQAYYERIPDVGDSSQLVSFGTSGHRGSPQDGSFTESHILAITQAICDYRQRQGITGPLFMGKDSHAVSAPAQRSALEVLAANGTTTIIQRDDGLTPTPVISRTILDYNRDCSDGLADGIVVTPSHNPPRDGGFKYNPPHGGPADTDVTGWIQDRANELLRGRLRGVRRMPFELALRTSTTRQEDFVRPYVTALDSVVDMESIRHAGLNIGVDPLGGSAVDYWHVIGEHYGVPLTVVNQTIDPTFRFMSVDHDGKIRMDCSSPHAMAGLVNLKDKFAVAFGNDPDADRHGIVTPSMGLMNPNHYLAVAVGYLLTHRQWSSAAVVGKTLVSSLVIDRVVRSLARSLWEVPVGFKWFAPRLLDGSCCFGGEESSGASFLRRDGTVWTTDKDGLILGLLAAEILATTGKDPGEHYHDLSRRFGDAYYVRIDSPVTSEQKSRLGKLSADTVRATQLAGESIVAKLTRAPGNNAPIGGIKVVTEHGWFAARPSGTENVYKLYAESLTSQSHLEAIVHDAQGMLAEVLEH